MTFIPIPDGTDPWGDSVNGAFVDQDTRIIQNTGDIATNQSNISSLSSALSTTNGNVTTNTNAISVNTSNISTLQGQMATAQGNISTLQSQMTAVQVAAAIARAMGPGLQNMLSWNYDPQIVSGGNTLVLGTVYCHRIWLAAGDTIVGLGTNATVAGATLSYARAGLYSPAGVQLGISVDQSVNWTSTGFKSNTLTSSVVIPTSGYYYIALLNTGTTGAQMGSTPGVQSVYNGNTSGATLRHATVAAGQTALPASFTPSGNASTNASTWVGAS